MKLDLITNKSKKQGKLNPNDEFYTPKYAIEPKGSKIWCPFDTIESNYVKILIENGYIVFYSHIFSDQDFFNMEVPDCHYIISNPPYSLKGEVFQRLFEICNVLFRCIQIG